MEHGLECAEPLPGRHIAFKAHAAQDDAELTDDYSVKRPVMCGTANEAIGGTAQPHAARGR